MFIPLEVSKRVSKKTKAIIAPPICYGYYSRPRSGGGEAFPGTTSVSGSTLLNLIKDITGEFIRHGFKKILVLNGHYENCGFITEGIELAIERSGKDDVKVLVVNWWDLIPKDVLDKVFEPLDFPGFEVEHAAVTETSIIQAVRPELVKEDKIIDDQAARFPPYEIIPPPPDITSESGVLWKATLASRLKGEMVLNVVVDKLVKVIEEELGKYLIRRD